MKKFFLLGMLFAATPVFALLSPLNQSVREIERILASPELSHYFGQHDKIMEIAAQGEGYLVRAGERQLVVEVVPLPSKKIGPKEFKLLFHPSE